MLVSRNHKAYRYVNRYIKSSILQCVLLLVLSSSGGLVFAQGEAVQDFGAAHYVQMLLGMLAVIAMIYGCAWLVKRLNGGGFAQAARMRVLSGLSLGTRERIVLVDVAGTQMLLGVAPGRVTRLHVFDEQVMPLEQQDLTPDFANKFKSALSQVANR